MRTPASVLAAIAGFALLQACGFHMQGRQPLPPSLVTARLDSQDVQTDFAHELRLAMKGSGVRLLGAGESLEKAAQVRIVTDEIEEHVLSVSSHNIPTDYELVYKVEIEVRADGKDLLPAEEFSLSRVYSFDETQLLAKEREKDILVQALARDLASVVMRRLASL